MEEKKNLKKFLVKKFLLVLLGIAICELGINILYSNGIFLVLRESIGGPIFENFGKNGSGTGTVYLTFFWLIFEGILYFLPEFISESVLLFVTQNFGGLVSKEIDMALNRADGNMLSPYFLGSFFIILILFAIAVSPYFVGAFAFSKMIGDELKALLKEDMRQHIEYDRKRSLMLSDIAHDLKTPITTVSGYAQALRDGMITDKEKQRQYLDAICTKSKRMDDLITLLFEFVKIDSEGFQLHKEQIDVVELLRENIALFYADFEQKGILLSIDIPEEQIIWNVDKLQFSRAVANLLANELRHVDKGGRVTIRLAWEDEMERLIILFGDSGRQITDAVAKHIFEPFVMGDASRNSKGGSGLGLSIASKIIKMHGGTLVLDRNSTEEYTKAFIIVLE